MNTFGKQCIMFDEGWSIMETGISKLKTILDGNEETSFKSEEYMVLYTNIYNMCVQKPPYEYSQELYDKYQECIKEYIRDRVLPSLGVKHNEFMLRELVKRWSNHKVMVRWLSRFFHYLDRYFVTRRSLPSLKEAGLTCFRDLINQEREGEQIDRALLKNVIDMFVEIGMGSMDYYENDFQDAMLIDTSSYYSRKASNWIVKDSCPDYMLKKVKNELLVVHTNQLLEKEHSGICILLKNDKVDDISRMYRLFHKISKGLEPVANMFKQHVSSEGMVLVQQVEDAVANKAGNAAGAQEQSFVRKVIELHDKYLAYVNNCFLNDTLIHKALKEAFEGFCNKVVAGSSCAELLASYSDDILKKGGSQKLSDEVIEETLEKVVILLAYISEKDLFAEFYRKKLSRRLLFDRSANDDHERFILTKLKQQCGAQFTSKMEGMITDLTLAKENQNHFQEYLSDNPSANPGMDLTVTVLTTGFWPVYKSSDLRLPAEMVKCVEVFKEFYQTKTKSRKLTWIYSLGTCNIKGNFEQKPIELVMGTYQAAVLLLFNDADRLSYSDIKTQLNLADEDLVRLLLSLSCAKYKILNKTPNTRSVSPNDSFEFNSKFTDRMRRIKIPLPSVDEKKKVVEDVEKDRRYNIDASLVRIMKSRKVLGYQQLVMECVEQLSPLFKPDIKLIKKRIEDLITRDYLERDGENPNLFKSTDLDLGWSFMQSGIAKLENILEGIEETQFDGEEYMMLYTTMVLQIDQEREGEQIDRALLKNVIDIFVEIGMESMDYYKNDFQDAMLIDTSAYYSRKASNWIVEDSCPDYMLKCLRKERERVPHYLHSSSEKILVKHVSSEAMVLVQQAEDAAYNKAFVKKMIELHDKYFAYVINCFFSNSLFHMALMEVFEVFCNKVVAGSSTAELLASFCDDMLKKGGSEKLRDEVIEETLDKVIFSNSFPFEVHVKRVVNCI
ncbi:hypothetical protein ACJIZ3_016655 [Penstemon smallii]|uniref:Cullin family profile domain-containing protein n=1 Tax=Penstemon smallii TaxID=265156 RepID=A0ABD3SUD5_9LAMI